MAIAEDECAVGPADAITALGETDDHLRLAVLLGRAASDRGDTSEDALGCIEAPSWLEKFDHLRRLLDTPSLDGLAFHDLDALWPGYVPETQRWDDRAFRRERSAVFELIRDAAPRRRWRLTRPVPRAPRLSPAEAPAALRADDMGSLASIVPEIRPLARNLIEAGIIDGFGLEDLVEAAGDLDLDPSESLIAYADERLTTSARDCALRLSLLRVEEPWNGVIGPYPIPAETSEGDDMPLHALERRAVEQLVALGLLHVAHDRARMPRLVRQFYVRRAQTTGDIDARSEHRWLATRRGTEPGELIERHHHAIEADDLDLAIETAEFYINDLRRLATRLGRRRGPGDVRRAARLFARITRKDHHDAYAWEYYGYNLAQLDPETEVIERAYRQACALEPDNPLYRGRLVGWIGRQGGDVVDETIHRISAEYGTTSIAASWFAFQVLSALERARRRDQIGQLSDRLGSARIDAWFKKQQAPQ